MKRPKRDRCVYCGKVGQVTRDHVPPRGIFTEPYPANLYTVPCCQPCNKSFCDDDEYFRDALAMSTSSTFGAVRQLTDAFERSFKRGKVSAAKLGLVSTLRHEDLYTSGGLYRGRSLVCDVEGERLSQVVERIVRGLFYVREKQRLPRNCPIYTYHAQTVSLKRPDLVPIFHQIAAAIYDASPPGAERGDAFAFRYAMVDRQLDRYASWWVVRFYNSHLYFVRTGRYSIPDEK